MAYREPPENVGFIIGDVSRMLRTVYDRRVEPLGLTRAQWRVLGRISRHEGCTQTELAAELEIEKPTLGRLPPQRRHGAAGDGHCIGKTARRRLARLWRHIA